MKKVILYFLLFFCGKIFAQQPLPSSPNIIFIIGDDISIDDIGAYGNSKVKTPSLNFLAANGLRFNNMFVASSSCSPSRTSILTGRYPHNTGAAELHTPLPKHLTYFPELLKKAGYYTALAGKWHEGKETARAYDTVIAGEAANGLGGEAQWINILQNRPANKPFFFWFSPFDAHRTWSADTFRITHDPATEVEIPETLMDDDSTRRDIASYYNEIGRLDYYVGKLHEALRKEGIADNTIIVFIADNARPFPGSKTRLNDRGLKTPFIFYWPSGIHKAGSVNALVSAIDIAPTFLQLAGAKPAESIQGSSFAKLLTNNNSDFRHYIFGEHNWHDYEAYERSVRTKDYLYIFNGRPNFDNGGPIDANQSLAAHSLKAARAKGKLTLLQEDAFVQPRPVEELYDLRKDSLQLHNLADDKTYTQPLFRLRKILKQWQQQTGDTQPEKLTSDWYDRETGNALPQKGQRGEMPGAARKADRINQKGIF
ncbi:heparan N-sulfatase [Terrimonas sp.]|uniref:sulfatase family protein n=1 Tax=Terrimonas sp. TaxID=1914338 RepID=UPI000D51DEF5|nr:sulfatase [Terrimonas sp.]PVD52837.1 heparan N-sulfatase [Terrimonas sp.]